MPSKKSAAREREDPKRTRYEPPISDVVQQANAGPSYTLRALRKLLSANQETSHLGSQRGFVSEAGISFRMLQLIETGKSALSRKMAMSLGSKFLIDPAWFFVGSPTFPPLMEGGAWGWTVGFFLEKSNYEAPVNKAVKKRDAGKRLLKEQQNQSAASFNGHNLSRFPYRCSVLISSALAQQHKRSGVDGEEKLALAMAHFMAAIHEALHTEVDVFRSLLRGENANPENCASSLLNLSDPTMNMFRLTIAGSIQALLSGE